MKIVVTGSEGSLMQAVIPHLLSQGHTVVGVDNFFRYGRIERSRDYELVEGDLADPVFTRQVIRGAEGVIQAAARIFGIGGFHKYPADILAQDVMLHRNVLLAAVDSGVSKVCYISSSMVYERCERHPSEESDVFEARVPSTDYGLSKLVGERLSMAFMQQYGLRYAIWRPFNIITPHEKSEREQGISHVFADFIQRIVIDRQNPLQIIGDGKQVRCFTWIDDVAATIARWTFTATTDGRAYNLGNREPITMIDLAALIHEEAQGLGLIPKTEAPLRFTTAANYPDDVLIRIPDVTRAAAELGWKATVPVRGAVRACLEHIVAAGR